VKKSWIFLTLMTSMSTLICCALPTLMVSLGLGAVLSGFLSSFPQLIWFSENKKSVFFVAALGLLLNGIWMWKNKTQPCPVDPQLREACLWGRKWGFRIYVVSLLLFLIGFFFAFLIPLLI